jgi:hypothetical protein
MAIKSSVDWAYQEKAKGRNLRRGSKKAIPNGPKGDEIYLNGLILVRQWRFALED